MPGQKLKKGAGGFLHAIFPVTVCRVRQLALVRREQGSSLKPWLCGTELSAQDHGQGDQDPPRSTPQPAQWSETRGRRMAKVPCRPLWSGLGSPGPWLGRRAGSLWATAMRCGSICTPACVSRPRMISCLGTFAAISGQNRECKVRKNDLLSEKRPFVKKYLYRIINQYTRINTDFSLKKNKHGKTSCVSVEVFLYRRGSDSAVLIPAGLPGVCDDLGWEHREICLQGGFHKQSLCESISLCVNKMIEIRTPSSSC